MSYDGAGYRRLCDDLVDEQRDLDRIVAPLTPADWTRLTPAVGWDVRDQIGHLAASEELACLAATDVAAFSAELARMTADLDRTESDHLARARAMQPQDVLEWWRGARAATLSALIGRDPHGRLPWAGPDMSAMSFVTARLMETWAHGQDVADALGIIRVPTGRLHHIAVLGIRTRSFSYLIRGRPAPSTDVRVELDAPGGERWQWGDPSVADRITGPALDFCLVVTQRRAVSDTTLDVTGPTAGEWMAIAQAFAGPPTAVETGRAV